MITNKVSSSFLGGAQISLKCITLVLIVDFVTCYPYPLYGGKKFFRTVPIRRSAFISIPVSHLGSEYQIPEYEDTVLPATTQEDFDFGSYNKYPFLQYFGYYPTRNYYHDKTRRLDGYGFYEDHVPRDDFSQDVIRQDKNEIYPYGQETWYEEEAPRFDKNAEANAAFLQNLIMAQMYQDAKDKYPVGYESGSDDYDDQNWLYGVPTTEVDDKEKVKQYFKNKEDEEVKELESLAREKEKTKKFKGKNLLKKQRKADILDKPTKPKSKMTDEEYFDMQKQIVVNSRKNSYIPVAEGLRLSKKQIYDSANGKNLFWNLYRPRNRTESPNTDDDKNDNPMTRNGFSDSDDLKGRPSTDTVLSTTATKRPLEIGQKEVVLPRPSNPIRRPHDISSRSLSQTSVYDTIKKLLNMEENENGKDDIPVPQKRFVLNEDQLTAELSGLKKKSA